MRSRPWVSPGRSDSVDLDRVREAGRAKRCFMTPARRRREFFETAAHYEATQNRYCPRRSARPCHESDKTTPGLSKLFLYLPVPYKPTPPSRVGLCSPSTLN